MSETVWRRLLVAGCTLAVFCAIWAAISLAIPLFGDLGFTTAPSSTPFALKVASVFPNGPAAAAGIKPGDLIDLRSASFAVRSGYVQPGTKYSIPIIDNGSRRSVSIVAEKTRTEPLTWLYIATDIWLVAFASVIGMRRGRSTDARLLALILFALAFGDLPIWIETKNAFADALLNLIASLILIAAYGLLTLYFSRFTRPLFATRRMLTAFVYAACVLQAIAMVLSSAAQFSGPWQPLLWSLIEGGSLLCGVLAAAATHGVDRRRIGWAVASFAPALGGYAIWHVLMLVAPSSPVDTFFRTFESCLWLLAPVALTYSLLTHRFIDIGFVLNRATIFAVVTVIVVGIFVVLEWSLGKLFEHISGVTDVSINVIVALTVGYSLRFIHSRVDRFVDEVFFKKRHQNETTLRRFAREAGFISDRETLLRRTLDTVRDNTEAESVEILLERHGVFVPAVTASANSHVIDENDPAVLSMKAWHDPVALHSVHSAIQGDIAFPLGIQGKVGGVLVCGGKRTGESYAPDEKDALVAVAQGVGSALGALDARMALLRQAERYGLPEPPEAP